MVATSNREAILTRGLLFGDADLRQLRERD